MFNYLAAQIKKLLPSEFFQDTFREATIFGVIGVFTVFVDLSVYLGLLWFDVSIWIAKAVAFIFGTIFAYFANKTFNFENAPATLTEFLKILILYLAGMVINVSLNSVIISILGDDVVGSSISYVVATASSAAFNFVGMKIIFTGSNRNLRRLN